MLPTVCFHNMISSCSKASKWGWYLMTSQIKAHLVAGGWAWSLCKEQRHFSCFHPPRHWSHYPKTKGHDWCWCLKMKKNSIKTEILWSRMPLQYKETTQKCYTTLYSIGRITNSGMTTFNRVNLKKNIFSLPSFKRSPSALVFFCLSEPARSTRCNFETTESALQQKITQIFNLQRMVFSNTTH